MTQNKNQFKWAKTIQIGDQVVGSGNSIYFNDSHSKFTKLHENSSIIMLDPVDPKRNLGTAVSLQNLHKFIYISKKFLDNPLNSSFTKNKHKIDTINELLSYVDIIPNSIVI